VLNYVPDRKDIRKSESITMRHLRKWLLSGNEIKTVVKGKYLLTRLSYFTGVMLSYSYIKYWRRIDEQFRKCSFINSKHYYDLMNTLEQRMIWYIERSFQL
jgi:hypothetical protein